ncbi:MAG: membrane protein insertase YidC, partial [Candidatus Symbiothrix sp.]|nr:membrane protein insertase YidC [Candidatus Symbiothrix sp.]
MNKNTIIGFLLILLILIGFSYLNKPSQAQLEAQKRYNDSIAIAQQTEALVKSLAEAQQQPIAEPVENLPDSVKIRQLTDKYGSFGISAQGEESFVTLENDLITLTLSTLGGRVYAVRLKEYTDYEKSVLSLFDGDESDFAFTFITANNHVLSSKDFYFQALPGASDKQAVLRLNAGADQYLDFVYTLDDYMVDLDIVPHNLNSEFSPAMRSLDIQWMQKLRQQEKGRKFEERYARLTYKYLADDVEELRESKDDYKEISNKLKWIGYKDQFFSSVLIAGENFETARLDSRYIADNPTYLKEYNTSTSVTYHPNDSTRLHFYFGPNDYALLKKYDKTKFVGKNLELEKLVPLGWSLFRYVNQYIIIPIFNWLTSFSISLGLAILLLTLIIKTALFPLTYKSFMSSAKMRVLKPQIEAITAKHPGQENALTRQQKTMELYKQVGVSPMAGCLPMLLQMPFLLALFMFFPSAIELRHE